MKRLIAKIVEKAKGTATKKSKQRPAARPTAPQNPQATRDPVTGKRLRRHDTHDD